MSTATEAKSAANVLIGTLKKLPREKQEYVSGYVQGIADANKELAQKQDKPA